MISRVLILTFLLSVVADSLAAVSPTTDAEGCSARAETATNRVDNERVLVAIEGMHCTSCASGIKAVLKRTQGVISAEVSYERREADVEYDPSRTSPEKILEAIRNMGYKASVKEPREG